MKEKSLIQIYNVPAEPRSSPYMKEIKKLWPTVNPRPTDKGDY